MTVIFSRFTSGQECVVFFRYFSVSLRLRLLNKRRRGSCGLNCHPSEDAASLSAGGLWVDLLELGLSSGEQTDDIGQRHDADQLTGSVLLLEQVWRGGGGGRGSCGDA